ncbi:unnamed protein product [Ixodes persulcatus]
MRKHSYKQAVLNASAKFPFIRYFSKKGVSRCSVPSLRSKKATPDRNLGFSIIARVHRSSLRYKRRILKIHSSAA